jgi:glycosyltransferase involved in cell wall biosynthesis
MKILFVCSGNSKNGISVIIKNQALSLEKYTNELKIEYFIIQGKGVIGYLRNIKPLKKLLKNKSFDIIHAHYSFSAFCASLAGAKPLVVTLMGSDVMGRKIYKYIIKIFRFIFKWENIIVQSNEMMETLNIKKVHVIPNGVDLNMFLPMDKTFSQSQLGWDNKKKNILFPANPQRNEKNYMLAHKSIYMLNVRDIELHCFDDTPHEQIPIWFNAADVVLLTSFREGSPNVIKEAMACNRPCVSTNVGDVSILFENEKGCFITEYDPLTCSTQIKNAIRYSDRYTNTNGRQRIIDLNLDDESIANKINTIYKNIL